MIEMVIIKTTVQQFNSSLNCFAVSIRAASNDVLYDMDFFPLKCQEIVKNASCRPTTH